MWWKIGYIFIYKCNGMFSDLYRLEIKVEIVIIGVINFVIFIVIEEFREFVEFLLLFVIIVRFLM